jgi:hypothetical protein
LPNEEDNDVEIYTHHASFCDFLQDPTRAGIFYVGGCQQHADLSRHILKAFSYNPSFDRHNYLAW